MLNRSILIGRLTKDPEIAYTQKGTAYSRFTLAVDRPFTNAQGDREADFIRVVTWGKTAEVTVNNLSKGRLIAVDGRIQTSSFDGQDGQRRYTTEVVAENVRFLDFKKNGNDSSGGHDFGTSDDMPDEELPF